MNKYMSAMIVTAGIFTAANVSANNIESALERANPVDGMNQSYSSTSNVDTYSSSINESVKRIMTTREKGNDIAEGASSYTDAAKTL